MDTPSTSLVVHNRPYTSWILGTVFFLLAVFGPLSSVIGADTLGLGIRILLGVAGLGLILFSPVLTVTADRPTQTLTLRHKSLLAGSRRQIPFSQIEAIQLEVHHKRRRTGSAQSDPTYRMVVVLKDSEMVPFHASYSSGTVDKTRTIRQLRAFIGVGGSEMGMGL